MSNVSRVMVVHASILLFTTHNHVGRLSRRETGFGSIISINHFTETKHFKIITLVFTKVFYIFETETYTFSYFTITVTV